MSRRRDCTIAEVRRILADLRLRTGCEYALEADGDAGAFYVVLIHRAGDGREYARIVVTGPSAAGEALAFLRAYGECLAPPLAESVLIDLIYGGRHAAH